MVSVEEVVKRLESMSRPENREGMARFGIKTDRALGIPMPELRRLAKELKKNHELSLRLWDTGLHEARILASLIDDPGLVTEAQVESWASGFDSWDVCDQCCSNLFSRTRYAYGKAIAWSQDGREYVRRAGFTLMATLAVHDKSAPDGAFELFFPFIIKGSSDERNFVKKAVSWALRQIGKRSPELNCKAIAVAGQLHGAGSRSARWIASDALHELQSPRVQQRLKKKRGKISAV